MDPRIADYIRTNRKKFTHQAITDQLVEAGHDRAEVERTWAALDAPDPDAVAGEGFWGRFALIVVGINVGVFLIVALLTNMLGVIGQGGLVLPMILAVALAIGALMAWGIVAATGPARMSPTTALVIGVLIPLLFALLIGGACFSLVGAIGPPPEPGREGRMELHVGPPLEFDASGAAYCQTFDGGSAFSVYPQQELGIIDGRSLHASIDAFPTEGGPDGAPAPAPMPGNEDLPNVNVNVSLHPRSEADPPQEWFIGPGTDLDVDASPDGLSGTVTFEGLEPVAFEPAGEAGGKPISGTLSWTCE
jgi:hypothetical protein